MSLLTVPGVVVTPGNVRSIPRWGGGVSFQPEDCDVPFDWTAGAADFPYWWSCVGDAGTAPTSALGSGPGETDGTKNISAGEAVETFDPIQLWAGYFCRAGSPDAALEAQARAIAKLEALTPTAIEHELWTGAVADLAGFGNAAFADSGIATLIQSGSPLGYVTALAELEQGIAASMPLSNPAIIHAQPRVVTAWAAEQLVTAVPAGTHLVTAAGTIVVPERGATGQSPGAVNPAQTANYAYSWAYATGMVHVYLSDPRTTDPMQSVNRAINDLEIRAERDFVAAWNPCGIVAARVALCDRTCLGGS